MFGSSPEQLSLDSSASLDDSAGGHVIGVSDDGDAGDDVTSQLLSAYLSKHRTPVSTVTVGVTSCVLFARTRCL